MKSVLEAELLGLERVSLWRLPHHGINPRLPGVTHQCYCETLVRRLRGMDRTFAFIVENDKGEIAVFASPEQIKKPSP